MELSNSARWGIWIGILLTCVLTVVYVAHITAVKDTNYKILVVMRPNTHVLFFGITAAVWVVVISALKLELKVE